MINLINNFINSTNFQSIINLITNKNFPWFIKTFDKHIEFNHTLKNSMFAPPIIEEILKKINATNLYDAKIKLITKTEKSLKLSTYNEYDKNSKKRCAIFYLNSNNGTTNISGYKNIQSKENSILILPSNTSFYETTCTDKACRKLIHIIYD